MFWRIALSRSVLRSLKHLSVTRNILSRLGNSKNGISPEMAVWLSKAFGSSPEMWLRLQMNYDLAPVWQKAATLRVNTFERV